MTTWGCIEFACAAAALGGIGWTLTHAFPDNITGMRPGVVDRGSGGALGIVRVALGWFGRRLGLGVGARQVA